jgi:superfamily II DNA or RNA helicase
VYCETLDFLDATEKQLSDEGIGWVRIDGSTPLDDRPHITAQFRDDPSVQVLLGSSVLDYGHNLQFCNWILSVDTTWNPAREQQREMRVRRLGSPHLTYTHTVLLPDTPKVRQDKAAALARKSLLLDQFLPETFSH